MVGLLSTFSSELKDGSDKGWKDLEFLLNHIEQNPVPLLLLPTMSKKQTLNVNSLRIREFCYNRER